MAVVKRAAVVAVLGVVGYFGFPLLAIVAGGAAWDGGPRFEENGAADAFFWLMMASFAVFVVAALTAVVALVTARARRSG